LWQACHPGDYLDIVADKFPGDLSTREYQNTNLVGLYISTPGESRGASCQGVHAYNYSDLPVYDIIFGTFKNPKNYVEETGFYTGASQRIGEMLLFRDVSQQKRKSELKSEKGNSKTCIKQTVNPYSWLSGKRNLRKVTGFSFKQIFHSPMS
jgi:hypothetical protein